MSLASIKINTEQYIKDNYVGDIYWDKQEIVNVPSIHIAFIPVDRAVYSTCNRKLDDTMIVCKAYGNNTLECMELHDSFRDVLECYSFGDTHYDVGIPSGGVENLHNGIVESGMNYSAITY